ncbi:MAG: ATP-binding protein [Bacteroidales bacterium]|nr:ATP-binding protein [Bacteroidales bacterium]
MLVNFTFENFRSFRDEATLSMEAAPIQELPKSIMERGGESLLPVAVIYGANSSGKSNVLKSLKDMRDTVLNSVKLNPKEALDAEPFCLDLTSEGKPTSYEIQFIVGDSKFRYGFDHDKEAIISEWLYEKRKGMREMELFLRCGDEFKISKARFAEGMGKQSATPANRLFVSLVAQLNGPISQSILEWFSHMVYRSGMDGKDYSGHTLKMILNQNAEARAILGLFESTNLGFQGIEIAKKPDSEMPLSSKTLHNVYDADGRVVGKRSFPTEKMESEGTKKIIEIAGPIIDALQHGQVLVVDELDAKLHPFLTRKIIAMFMDLEVNAKGAQLLFATHDTNLLNLQYLRRDQIWFTEKDAMDASTLYSLVEFRNETGAKVRNDRNIAKDYINGRYGAIPFMS